MTDWVDGVQQQWQRLQPDLDVSAAGVFLRILRTASLVHDLTDRALAAHGLDRVGFQLLSALVRSDRPLAPTLIASELHLSAPAITKRVRQLETDGLIARRPHENDGRSVLVELTERGRERVFPAISAIHRIESGWLAQMSPPDRELLPGALSRLLVQLEHEGDGS